MESISKIFTAQDFIDPLVANPLPDGHHRPQIGPRRIRIHQIVRSIPVYHWHTHLLASPPLPRRFPFAHPRRTRLRSVER
jgi:hypothetical protein